MKTFFLLAAGAAVVTLSSCAVDSYGYNSYGSHQYSSYNYSSYPYGYSRNHLPVGYNAINIGGTRYWHCNDHYYRHYPDRGYVVVRRPAGRPVFHPPHRSDHRDDHRSDHRDNRDHRDDKYRSNNRSPVKYSNSSDRREPSNYKNPDPRRSGPKRPSESDQRRSGPTVSIPRVQPRIQPRVPVKTSGDRRSNSESEDPRKRVGKQAFEPGADRSRRGR